MPAESEKQRRAAGIALSAKRGETPVSELKGAAKQMYDSMSEQQLRDFAKKASVRAVEDTMYKMAGVELGNSDKAFVRGFMAECSRRNLAPWEIKIAMEVLSNTSDRMRDILKSAKKVCDLAVTYDAAGRSKFTKSTKTRESDSGGAKSRISKKSDSVGAVTQPGQMLAALASQNIKSQMQPAQPQVNPSEATTSNEDYGRKVVQEAAQKARNMRQTPQTTPST